MTAKKVKTEADIPKIKLIVAELESHSEKGDLSKSVYKRLASQAKAAAGTDWGELAGAIERFKP